MRLDRALTLAVVSPLRSASHRTAAAPAPVLMYHSVSEDPETGVAPYYRLATPPVLFEQHLQILKSRGFVGVDLATLMARPTPSGVGRPVVITFDDGFRDFHTHAWPLLQRHGFTATMFLPTAFIHESRQAFKERECMTWPEIRDLNRAGITFGSHTVNHPKLATLPEAELRAELVVSRQTIERELSRPIDTFAHPYAFPEADRDYVRRYRRCVTEAGYRYAVTTTIGRTTASDAPDLIKRLPVNGADDAAFFAAKLEGHYDWMGRVQSALRRVKRLLQPARR